MMPPLSEFSGEQLEKDRLAYQKHLEAQLAARDKQIATQDELIARLRGALITARDVPVERESGGLLITPKAMAAIIDALNSTPESLAKVAEAKAKVIEAAIEACERGWVMGNGDLHKAVNALQSAEQEAK